MRSLVGVLTGKVTDPACKFSRFDLPTCTLGYEDKACCETLLILPSPSRGSAIIQLGAQLDGFVELMFDCSLRHEISLINKVSSPSEIRFQPFRGVQLYRV